MEKRIIFRVDAGSSVGLGHIRRCLSLAAGLAQLGGQCTFMTCDDERLRSHGSALGFEIATNVMSGDSEDLEQVLDIADRNGAEIAVVDSYKIDGGYLRRLRASGLYVVAIDDLGAFPFPCQLVINGGAQAHQLEYRSSSGDTQFLLGPQYALLSSEFWNRTPRGVRDLMQTALVSFGGTDPYNLTPRVLETLDSLPGEFTVTAVTSPFFENRSMVEDAARSRRHKVKVVTAPRSMRTLMLESDLAFSAAGQTLYELAATGTPAVAVQTADNQRQSMAALEAKGIVRVAGRADDIDLMDKMRSLTLRLTASERAQMSHAGRNLVDGQGALRAAKAVLNYARYESM
ncbi:UDP-2,4-diacetamido-2,4,6-trideoxy-beta-L-altropyranose hydrolase [Candidatus Bathyarchaeota archaeon]|nr:UDP-2,4-diacetamido-2,4,6-trideoxy-beta-L-altropyranose hydrolase [Candidatus Bathyarchaeota archaeon]